MKMSVFCVGALPPVANGLMVAATEPSLLRSFTTVPWAAGT